MTDAVIEYMTKVCKEREAVTGKKTRILYLCEVTENGIGKTSSTVIMNEDPLAFMPYVSQVIGK